MHKPSACWACHDWVMVDIGGRMVATYCETCAMTVDEWVMLSGSTLASNEPEKTGPPEGA